MKFRCSIIAILMCVFSSQLSAESRSLKGELRLSVEVNQHSFKPEVRAAEGLGNLAGGVDFSGVYYFAPRLAVKLGFGFGAIEDDESFSLQLVNNRGDISRGSSTVDWSQFFGEILYQSPGFDKGFGYRGGLGYNFIPDTERSITICVDCPAEDISLRGGGYLTAGVFYRYSVNGKFGLSARQYMSGDLQNGVMVFWEMRGRK